MRELRGLVVGWLAFGVLAGTLAGCGGDGSATGGGGAGGAGGSGGQSTSSSATTSSSECTNTVELGEGECRGNEDCTESAASCAPPGSPFCGGAGCLLDPCGIDSDCPTGGGPMVCEIDECCGDKRCVPGCVVDTDCEEGFSCTPDQHCVPQPCQDVACPANFDCGDGVVPSCTRRACSCDSECEGACVVGGCYPAPGTCELPSP